MATPPQDHTQPPPDEERLGAELGRFVFECPECKRLLNEYGRQCPYCGAKLASAYSATYVPFKSALAKIVSWAALILFVGSMLALAWVILTGKS
jgi:RNA polymerase subunit RPABC4/transcription elongation factor Spt4